MELETPEKKTEQKRYWVQKHLEMPHKAPENGDKKNRDCRHAKNNADGGGASCAKGELS